MSLPMENVVSFERDFEGDPVGSLLQQIREIRE